MNPGRAWLTARMDLDTLVLHAGALAPYEGEVVTPIFQSATFATDPRDPPRYSRLNNTPNQQLLSTRLAATMEAEAALVTTSGMAAITTTLLSCLEAGDHVVAQDCLYGGALAFLRQLAPRMGIETTFVSDGDWAGATRANTKLLYVETLSNPLLQVTDLEAAAGFARSRGLLAVVDNTFASPVNLRPLRFGFDLELHSATKYLNGHSDIVARRRGHRAPGARPAGPEPRWRRDARDPTGDHEPQQGLGGGPRAHRRHRLAAPGGGRHRGVSRPAGWACRF